MNKHFQLKATLLVAAMLIWPAAQAANMSRADYTAGKSQIKATYKSEKANCSSLAGNAKDICIEEAKAHEKVALADLEYSYTGRATDKNKLLIAKAETNYAVAKEKCDDQAGNAKDVCVKEAKAVEVRALADAKLGKEIGAAQNEASDAKRDADYKAAAERCDALAGDAKTNCITDAKAKFGKY